MSLKNKISIPVIYLISLVIILIGILSGPFVPIPVAVLGAIIWFFLSFMLHWNKPLQKGDLLLMFLITAGFIFIGFFLQYYTFVTVPLWKIVLAGIIVDGILFLTGFIPVVGDFIGGFISFFILLFFIGGIPGIILGVVALMIAMLPGPIPLVTISFIIIKLQTELLKYLLGVAF